MSSPTNAVLPGVALSIEIALMVAFTTWAIIHVYRLRKSNAPNEYQFLSARASTNWLSTSLTLMASLMGNWLVFLPADFGASFSLVGVIGYAISSIMPLIILALIGPAIVERMELTDFASTDYYRSRYGNVVHVVLSSVSLLYMWISLVAELTTVAFTVGILTNNAVPAYASILPVSLATLIYTSYSGLRASISTDYFQAIFILIVGSFVVAAGLWSAPQSAVFGGSHNFAPSGSIMASVVLILTVYPSELLNQGSWQRLLAAKTPSDLRKSFYLTSVAIFISVVLFGIMGMISASSFPGAQTSGRVITLLLSLNSSFLLIILVLAIALVSSSVDTLQNAMAAVLGKSIINSKLSMNWARLFVVLVNIPAIAVASLRLNIFNLFFTANLLSLTIVAPQLLSLISYITNIGALFGFFFGLLTMLIIGWITSQSFFGAFLFFYPSDVSNVSYLVAGILCPVVGVLATFFGSWIERRFLKSQQSSVLSVSNTKNLHLKSSIGDVAADNNTPKPCNVTPAIISLTTSHVNSVSLPST